MTSCCQPLKAPHAQISFPYIMDFAVSIQEMLSIGVWEGLNIEVLMSYQLNLRWALVMNRISLKMVPDIHMTMSLSQSLPTSVQKKSIILNQNSVIVWVQTMRELHSKEQFSHSLSWSKVQAAIWSRFYHAWQNPNLQSPYSISFYPSESMVILHFALHYRMF